MAKKPNEEMSISDERKAVRSPNQRLTKILSASTHKKAEKAFANLKDHSFVPKSLYEAATAQ